MYLSNRDKRLMNNIGYQTRPIDRDPVYTDAIHIAAKYKYTNQNLPYYNRTDHDGVKQAGTGIESIDDVTRALEILKYGTQTALNLYSSETGNAIKNMYGKWMNNRNPNWRPGFAGEKHMVNSNGVTYNYLGPGTKLHERLRRGDPPLDGLNGLDAAAKIHDIDYDEAKSWDDVRVADKKFIDNVEKSNASSISKKVIKGLMKSKMIGEDLKLVKPADFTSFPNIQDDEPDMIGKGIAIKRKVPKDPLYKLKRKLKGKKKVVNLRQRINNSVRRNLII